MAKTIIVTDCGHQYKTGYPPSLLAGCTTDCRVCGALLIFPVETTKWPVAGARGFHAYMHQRDKRWPVTGADTGYLEF